MTESAHAIEQATSKASPARKSFRFIGNVVWTLGDSGYSSRGKIDRQRRFVSKERVAIPQDAGRNPGGHLFAVIGVGQSCHVLLVAQEPAFHQDGGMPHIR